MEFSKLVTRMRLKREEKWQAFRQLVTNAIVIAFKLLAFK